MPDCPHCSVAIEHLPGFIAQAKHVEQLASVKTAKDAEIAQFATKVAELEPQAQGHAALVASSADWQAKYETLSQSNERTALLGTMQISADKLPGIEQLWQSAQASRAEADRAPFDAWLGAEDGAKAHPLLGALFTVPAVTGDATAQPAAVQATGLPTTAGPVATPAPPNQGKMTDTDTAKYFSSPEYRALSPADQKVKLAEMRAAHSGHAVQPA